VQSRLHVLLREPGRLGASPKNMTLETARQAVELLIQGAEAGAKLNLAFLGGEPLANRAVLRAVTEYAMELAVRRS